MLPIDIKTARWVAMKFGTEGFIEGEYSWVGFDPVPQSLGFGAPKVWPWYLWSLSHVFYKT